MDVTQESRRFTVRDMCYFCAALTEAFSVDISLMTVCFNKTGNTAWMEWIGINIIIQRPGEIVGRVSSIHVPDVIEMRCLIERLSAPPRRVMETTEDHSCLASQCGNINSSAAFPGHCSFSCFYRNKEQAIKKSAGSIGLRQLLIKTGLLQSSTGMLCRNTVFGASALEYETQKLELSHMSSIFMF